MYTSLTMLSIYLYTNCRNDFNLMTQGGFLTLQKLVDKFIICNPDTTLLPGVVQCKNTKSAVLPKLQVNPLNVQPSSTNAAYDINGYYIQLNSSRGVTFDSKYFTQVIESEVGLYPISDWVRINSNFPSGSYDQLNYAQMQAYLAPYLQLPLTNSYVLFPTQATTVNFFYVIAGIAFPLLMILAFLFPLSRILASFIREKEMKFRELTKIMGINDSTIILSWYITYGIIGFISSLAMAVTSGIMLFPIASIAVQFAFFFLFLLNVISFGFFVSSLFSKVKTGAIVGVVIFFLMFTVSFGADSFNRPIKFFVALLPPVTFGLGINVLCGFATTGVPLVLSSQFKSFSFMDVLTMEIVDLILFTLLGAYLDQVLPKEWGTRQPFYFFLTPRYWGFLNRGNQGNVQYEIEADKAQFIEAVSNDLKQQEKDKVALMLNGLEKHFDTPVGVKVAVKNMCISFYTGQITCLLGYVIHTYVLCNECTCYIIVRKMSLTDT